MLAGSTGHSAVRGWAKLQIRQGPQNSSWFGHINCSKARLRRQRVPVASASGNASGDASGNSRRKADASAANGGLDPALERAVPPDQRPVNELKALRQTTLYSWVRDALHTRPMESLHPMHMSMFVFALMLQRSANRLEAEKRRLGAWA